MYCACVHLNCKYYMMNQNPEIAIHVQFLEIVPCGFDLRSCPRSEQFDRNAKSNPLLSPPIGIWGSGA